MASRTLYDVSALFIGLGRVGVVRRAYRSSVNNTQDALRHFFFSFFFTIIIFERLCKRKLYEISSSFIHELRWKDFFANFGPCCFRIASFRPDINLPADFFFFYRKTENLLFVVKGKCTTVI